MVIEKKKKKKKNNNKKKKKKKNSRLSYHITQDFLASTKIIARSNRDHSWRCHKQRSQSTPRKSMFEGYLWYNSLRACV